MTLPIWITPRMKECFETMLEELLLHNSHAILTFTIYGVTIGNVNTQEQQIITVHELSEDSKLIDEFLNNDPELYDSPVEKIVTNQGLAPIKSCRPLDNPEDRSACTL